MLLGQLKKPHYLLSWVFAFFFAMEQFLNWHHSHQAATVLMRPANSEFTQSLAYLILLADSLHNLIGGLAIGSTLSFDTKAGLSAALSAALHELPQELGDIAVFIACGWSRPKALLLNFLSGLSFLVGALITWFFPIQAGPLIPIAAGNFIYVAAADLIPEVKKHGSFKLNLLHFLTFMLGVALIYLLR